MKNTRIEEQMLRKPLGSIADAENRYPDGWKIQKIWFSSGGFLHSLDTYVDYFNLIFNPQSEYL